MAGIDTAMIRGLREASGAGIMDCKTALHETGGDREAAIDWLRKKGLAKAARKAGRTAREGLVAAAVHENGTGGASGALVEVNSETDFVARNQLFQDIAGKIAQTAVSVGDDFDALCNSTFPGTGKSVSEYIAEMVGQIGENMTLRRSAGICVEKGVVVSYIHSPVNPSAGKIGVLVALDSAGSREALAQTAKQLAMHVAATAPLAARIEDLDREILERERSVLAEEARASGKPENIIAKMVEGRMQKFFQESVLLEQTFVVDGETKISGVLEKAAAQAGAPVRLAGFRRLQLGDGIAADSDGDG